MLRARSISGNWTPLAPLLCALLLLGAATASGPMPRRAMSTLQMCNPELATVPSALDAFAARMLDFFALSQRAIVVPDQVAAAPKRPNAAAAPRAPPALDSLAPHFLARSEHRIGAKHELGAAVDVVAATESRVRAHLQAESRVGPSTGATKKCPPRTLEDYRVWIPPLADHIVALGYLFTVIALVIFIPQLISIIRRNSTIGVSLTTMVFSIISGANQFWNVYLLDYWQVRACYEVGAAECMPHIQPIAQAAAGYLAMLPLFITALVIFVREDATDQRNPEYDDVVWFWGIPRRKAIELIIVVSWSIFFSVLSLVLLSALGACATTTIEFAQVQGVMNSVLTVFQWWPQILLTLGLKEQGSLSMPMLIAIQVTDALAIYYLYALGQDWSVWISTAVDLTMVTLLVLIVVYYETCGAPAKVRRSQQHGHADSAGGGADHADADIADGSGRSGTLRGGRASSADEHGANSEVRRLLAGDGGRVGSVSTSFAGGKEPISIDSTL